MIVAPRRKIVLLGMMSRMPVPGNIWLVAQYLVGFERLGFEAYYVESHDKTATALMRDESDDAALRAAEFIADVMNRFDLPDRWAYHSLSEGRCFGMTVEQLRGLYASADLIVNLHGGTVPLPEHAATGRLIFLETDPVHLQIELHNNDETAMKFLEPHVAFFSWGINYGHPDCKVPQHPRFTFQRTLPPVLRDFWPRTAGAGALFTTVGNWHQGGRVKYRGDVYYWSKDREFKKVLDLPARVGPQFELALSRSSLTPADASLLTSHGWRLRDSFRGFADLDAYRAFIAGSRGEFTVAKDQNVRLRSGWFSERSATYLAAGRPVVTQDTGFGNTLPTGAGLFPFSTIEQAAEAIDAINDDYQRHCDAAAGIARDHFSHDVVLKQLLDAVGVSASAGGGRTNPGEDELQRLERHVAAVRSKVERVLEIVERTAGSPPVSGVSDPGGREISNPVFLLGAGRCGSTFLQIQLSRVSDLWIWGEHDGVLRQFFQWSDATQTSTRLGRFSFTQPPDVASRLVSEARATAGDLRRAPWVNGFRPEHIQDIEKAVLHRMFAERLPEGRTRWGFKEIRYGIYDRVPERLLSLFPDARIVHVLRAPFETVESSIFTWKLPELKQAVASGDAQAIDQLYSTYLARWMKSCAYFLELRRRFPSHVFAAHIEHLDAEWEPLLAFLDLKSTGRSAGCPAPINRGPDKAADANRPFADVLRERRGANVAVVRDVALQAGYSVDGSV